MKNLLGGLFKRGDTPKPLHPEEWHSFAERAHRTLRDVHRQVQLMEETIKQIEGFASMDTQAGMKALHDLNEKGSDLILEHASRIAPKHVLRSISVAQDQIRSVVRELTAQRAVFDISRFKDEDDAFAERARELRHRLDELRGEYRAAMASFTGTTVSKPSDKND